MDGARVGAAVMASGQSARFGGGNKLLMPVGGMMMIERALAALPPDAFVRRVVVTRDARIADIARARGFEAVLHDLPDVSDTIRLCVDALSGLDGILFCVADQPFLTQATVRALCAAFRQNPQRVHRAAFAGRAGNPVLFPSACFDALSRLKPGQTGRDALRAYPFPILTVEATCARELADIDTTNDYRTYVKGE